MPLHVINEQTSDPQLTIFQRKTILTDAQIKAATTTYPELVPAPGTGKILAFHSAMLSVKTNNGDYTNIDPAVTLAIVYGDWLVGATEEVNADAALAAPVPRLAFFPKISDVSGSNRVTTMGWEDRTNYENQPLKFGIYNQAAGAITGGHPSNTIEVTVFYSIVDL